MAKPNFADLINTNFANATPTVQTTVIKNQSIRTKYTYTDGHIERTHIIPNPLNARYSKPTKKIEDIKNSILANGLLHNLVIVKNSATDFNTYRLISGELRWSAISKMTEEEYREIFPDGIPCKIMPVTLTQEDELALLIEANFNTRELSVYERLQDIKDLKNIYNQKKETGEIKNVNQAIAETLGITERQIAKYLASSKLIPELLELLKNGDLNMNEAATYGVLSEESQKEILKRIEDKREVEAEYVAELRERDRLRSSNEEDIKKYQSEIEKKDKMIAFLENQLKQVEDDSVKEKYETLIQAEKEKKEEAKKKVKEASGSTEKEAKNIVLRKKLEKNVASIEKQVDNIIKEQDIIKLEPDMMAKLYEILDKLQSIME